MEHNKTHIEIALEFKLESAEEREKTAQKELESTSRNFQNKIGIFDEKIKNAKIRAQEEMQRVKKRYQEELQRAEKRYQEETIQVNQRLEKECQDYNVEKKEIQVKAEQNSKKMTEQLMKMRDQVEKVKEEINSNKTKKVIEAAKEEETKKIQEYEGKFDAAIHQLDINFGKKLKETQDFITQDFNNFKFEVKGQMEIIQKNQVKQEDFNYLKFHTQANTHKIEKIVHNLKGSKYEVEPSLLMMENKNN